MAADFGAEFRAALVMEVEMLIGAGRA